MEKKIITPFKIKIKEELVSLKIEHCTSSIKNIHEMSRIMNYINDQ